MRVREEAPDGTSLSPWIYMFSPHILRSSNSGVELHSEIGNTIRGSEAAQ